MLSIKGIAFMAFIAMAFIVCVKFSQKHCKKSNLKWWKLLVELFIISFIFYISILAFGLFGIDMTGLKKEDMQLLEVFILLVIPGLFIIITRLVAPMIMKTVYKNYEETGRHHLLLLHSLVFNRFYKITVLANVLYRLTSKIF